jgi:hypothetical protein
MLGHKRSSTLVQGEAFDKLEREDRHLVPQDSPH